MPGRRHQADTIGCEDVPNRDVKERDGHQPGPLPFGYSDRQAFQACNGQQARGTEEEA